MTIAEDVSSKSNLHGVFRGEGCEISRGQGLSW